VTRALLPQTFAIAIIAILALGPAAACGGAGSAAAPVRSGATSTAPAPAERTAAETAPRPASERELERYAEREREATGLERFTGGRGQETTIIIILLVAILVVILI
jgi:hypothetical protein